MNVVRPAAPWLRGGISRSRLGLHENLLVRHHWAATRTIGRTPVPACVSVGPSCVQADGHPERPGRRITRSSTTSDECGISGIRDGVCGSAAVAFRAICLGSAVAGSVGPRASRRAALRIESRPDPAVSRVVDGEADMANGNAGFGSNTACHGAADRRYTPIAGRTDRRSPHRLPPRGPLRRAPPWARVLTCRIRTRSGRATPHLSGTMSAVGVEQQCVSASAGQRVSGSAGQRVCGSRTTTMGQVAWWVRCCPTEPSRASENPPCPRFPTTSNPAPLASSRSTPAGWP